MIGASPGKSNTRAVLVQARKPLPISALPACVSSRMMEVLPLCTLPSSQTTGANPRALSAMGACVSELLIACSWDLKCAASVRQRRCDAGSFTQARACRPKPIQRQRVHVPCGRRCGSKCSTSTFPRAYLMAGNEFAAGQPETDHERGKTQVH